MNLSDDLLYELDEKAPPEYKCPITLSLMKDPVIMPDGQTYDREAIRIALRNNPVSPITRQPMNISQALTNYALKSLIEKYIQENISSKSETKSHVNEASLINEKLKKVDTEKKPEKKGNYKIIISIVVSIPLIIFIGYTQKRFILTILRHISNSFLPILNFLGRTFLVIFDFLRKACLYILTTIYQAINFIIGKILFPFFSFLWSQIKRAFFGCRSLMPKFWQFVKLLYKIFINFLNFISPIFSDLCSMLLDVVSFIKEGFLRLFSLIPKLAPLIKNLFSALYSMLLCFVTYTQELMKFVGMMLIDFVDLVRIVLCQIILYANHILNSIYQVLAVKN